MAENLPPSSADVTEPGSLNFPEPSGPHRPVIGLFYFLYRYVNRMNLSVFVRDIMLLNGPEHICQKYTVWDVQIQLIVASMQVFIKTVFQFSFCVLKYKKLSSFLLCGFTTEIVRKLISIILDWK
jgi:hypothetical protein